MEVALRRPPLAAGEWLAGVCPLLVWLMDPSLATDIVILQREDSYA
jgi:hypothetical protein